MSVSRIELIQLILRMSLRNYTNSLFKTVQASHSCFLILIATLLSCNNEKSLFEKMSSSHTGISFNNTITENDSVNILDFEYLYNGGGVGIGDFNNDGLPDVFFSANQKNCRLYLNENNFQFKDITDESGIKTPYWNTGVCVVDINQDGWLDIYLCTSNIRMNQQSPNQLFINQGNDKNGIPSFKESATEVGLADMGYSTQAVFFDYDNDQDLDCYVLTNALENYNRALAVGQKTDGTGKSTDRLYRNDGNATGGLPKYVNVSKEAGITIEGWGLGIGVADFNDDGWMDIYCANDFQSNDLLWLNNGNGTFTNRINEFIRHQSLNAMGVDIGDINNDGLPEIITVDMMPEDNLRQKTMFSRSNYELYKLHEQKKYQPQFVRNVLQLNRGMDHYNQPIFSDIGFLSGVYATDWSWAPLLADFDNDGWRDLYITNGYPKDISNLDFTSFTGQSLMSLNTEDKEIRKAKLEKMKSFLGVQKSNVMFHNKGDLTFDDVTLQWGLKVPSFSNGVAYADFDKDGDLDIVINTINSEALVYRNRLEQKKNEDAGSSNFLRFSLKGIRPNSAGYGAKVTVYYDQQKQVTQHTTCRGYKSSVEPILHFGMGKASMVDSLKIEWQSKKVQSIYNLPVNQTIILDEINAARPHFKQPSPLTPTIFADVAYQHNLLFKHEETDFVDFNHNFLLHHKFSQGGPAMAAGDLNGDNLDDVFIGGAMRKPATVFYQHPNGSFSPHQFLPKIHEDMGVLIFDADNDNDNDIYCASGSSEFGLNTKNYQDRFYRNAGHGKFNLDTLALPEMLTSSSCVNAADFDNDGDLDLFIGGRFSPEKYPLPPESYLLRNDGKGIFEDVTGKLAPELRTPGMVTSALWTDFDNDNWMDLVVVGEFMPISFYKNSGGKFKKSTVSDWDVSMVGWWNSITGGDFDNDGDIDYIAGNLGLNSIFKASIDEPVCLYAKDYNSDGKIDPVLCRFIQGKQYPVHYRDNLIDQIVGLKKTLYTYTSYGEKSYHEIFPEKSLSEAYILRATQMASVYIENKGSGIFKYKALPVSAQVSPVFGALPADINNDNNLDLILVGNDFSTETLSGRQDASIGLSLLGNGKGDFHPVELKDNGLKVSGDAKSFIRIRLKSNDLLYLAAQNQDSLRVFQNNHKGQIINTQQFDVAAEIIFADSSRRKLEFYYSEGYLSQSSRILVFPHKSAYVNIKRESGVQRKIIAK